MQLQIDFIRLFKASGWKFLQREYFRCDTGGAVAGQDIERIQPAPAVVVIGKFQNAGTGGFHPPFRCRQQDGGHCQKGNSKFFQGVKHYNHLSFHLSLTG